MLWGRLWKLLRTVATTSHSTKTGADVQAIVAGVPETPPAAPSPERPSSIPYDVRRPGLKRSRERTTSDLHHHFWTMSVNQRLQLSCPDQRNSPTEKLYLYTTKARVLKDPEVYVSQTTKASTPKTMFISIYATQYTISSKPSVSSDDVCCASVRPQNTLV